jgi:tetratricopeptide (TPR) repeat protein
MRRSPKSMGLRFLIGLVGAATLANAALGVPIESTQSKDAAPRSALGATTGEAFRRGIEVRGVQAGSGDPLSEALDSVRAGRFADAIGKARAFIATNPRSAAAHEVLGVALLMEGKTDEALRTLRRAVEFDPKQSTARVKIGDILLARNEIEAAKRSFTEAVRLSPTDRLPHQRLGIIAEREGDIGRAIDHYERGLVGAPSDYLGVRVDLARLYNQRNQFDKARLLLEGPLRAASGDANAHLVLGTSLLALRRFDEAAKQYSFALQAEPKLDGALLGLGIARRETGDFTGSVAVLTELISLKPKSSTGYYQLGETYLAMGRPKEALTEYARARPLSPDPRQIRLRMADALLADGEVKPAIQIYEELARGKGASLKVLNSLGNAYLANDQPDLARKTFDRAVAEHPKEPAAFLMLGSHLAATRDYRGAVAAYDKGLKFAPKDPALLQAQALAYSRVGDPVKAIDVASRLVDVTAGNLEAKFLLASLRDEAGQREAAMQGYREILGQQPNHVGAINNLAMTLSLQGQHEQAMKLAQRARDLAPKNVLVLDTVGFVQLNSGRTSEALSTLRAASTLAPENPTILYRLGTAQLKAGDRAAAKSSLQKALELAPQFRYATEARKLLATL